MLTERSANREKWDEKYRDRLDALIEMQEVCLKNKIPMKPILKRLPNMDAETIRSWIANPQNIIAEKAG